MARNYKGEYKNYHSKPKQNRALKKGTVKKGDKKDIDHKDGNPRNNKKSNLRVQSRSANRSFPRNKRAGKKRRKT